MSSSLLERARGFHEDLEIYERAIIEQLENKPRTQKVRCVLCDTAAAQPSLRVVLSISRAPPLFVLALGTRFASDFSPSV